MSVSTTVLCSTVFLLPVSTDLTGDSRLETVLRRRQADRPNSKVLLCTPSTSGLQPHKSCRTTAVKIIALPKRLLRREPQEKGGPTHVIVEVALTVVERFVDDDLFHLEGLLPGRIALVQGVLPQDHREAAALSVGAETQVDTSVRLAHSAGGRMQRGASLPTRRESSGQRSGPSTARSDSRHSGRRSPCSGSARKWQPSMGGTPRWQRFLQRSSAPSSWSGGRRWSPRLPREDGMSAAQKGKGRKWVR